MPRRFRFNLTDLLWLMLVVAAFTGGNRFEREQRSRENDAAQLANAKSAAVAAKNPQARTHANPHSVYFLDATPER